MISRGRSWSITAVLVLACGWLVIHHGQAGKNPATATGKFAPGAIVAPPQASANELAANHEPPRDAQPMAHADSLRDTMPDGDVSVGFGGQLAPDLLLRRLFDYHLSRLGETSLSDIRERLHEDLLRRKLAAPLIAQVMQTFDRYVSYQQAASALADAAGSTLGEQSAQLEALRQRMLGDVLADAFYGEEQARQRQLLQRLAIDTTPELSPAEKVRRLQMLETAMPAAAREARAQAGVGDLVQQQTAQFDETNAEPAARHAERAQVWGDAAADRLAQLDVQRAQWQARLADYQRQRQRIRTDDALDDSQQQAALQGLLQASFHGREQLQVQAMEGAGLLGASQR